MTNIFKIKRSIIGGFPILIVSFGRWLSFYRTPFVWWIRFNGEVVYRVEKRNELKELFTKLADGLKDLSEGKESER